MTKVFVSGSMKIRRLDRKVVCRLDRILDQEFWVLVGDAKGVDSSVQDYLKSRGAESVYVYCTGGAPRNNIGEWEAVGVESKSPPGTRQYYTAKDVRMATDCDYGFMIWDCRSTGTLSNAIELLTQGKKALVYVNKAKEFLTLSKPGDLLNLTKYMAPTAFAKADAKLGLRRKMEELTHQQTDIFMEPSTALGIGTSETA